MYQIKLVISLLLVASASTSVSAAPLFNYESNQGQTHRAHMLRDDTKAKVAETIAEGASKTSVGSTVIAKYDNAVKRVSDRFKNPKDLKTPDVQKGVDPSKAVNGLDSSGKGIWNAKSSSSFPTGNLDGILWSLVAFTAIGSGAGLYADSEIEKGPKQTLGGAPPGPRKEGLP